MNPFANFGRAARLKRRQAKRQAALKRVPNAQLLLEELENRTLLSVLPTPTPGTPQNLGNPFTTGVNPQVAQDPTNSKILVEFNSFGPADLQYAGTPPADNDNALSFLEGRYSLNGGTTWQTLAPGGSSLGSQQNLENPLASTPLSFVAYTTVSTPSVAFDSQHNAYVIYTEYTAADTAGVVLFSKYNFSSPTPTVVFENHVLYQWAGQDPAYNPVVAIDTNQASFTDPTSNQIQKDPLASTITQNGQTVPEAVYVAWNDQQTLPLNSIPTSLNFILVEGSDNGGQSFSTQQYVQASGSSVSTSSVLAPLSTATISAGVPIGTAIGDFFNDPRDTGHDIVAITGNTITTMLVNESGQIVNTATTSLGLPGGAFPISMVTGPFNGDQYTDLAVTYFDPNTDGFYLQSYLSAGDGTFTENTVQGGVMTHIAAVPLPGEPAEGTIVTGNFVNGNSNADIAIGYTGVSGGAVDILIGSGNGIFTAVGQYASSANASAAAPISLAVGQFDTLNDTFEDLVVANAGTNDIAILVGNGDGTFRPPTGANSISAGGTPADIAVGNFNDDAFNDIAILTNTTGTNAQGLIAFGAGNGTFMLPGIQGYDTFPVTKNATAIAVADFNGDGEADIASVDEVTAGSIEVSTLSVTTGNGDGSFNPIFTDPTTVTGPVALVAGHLFNNEFADIVVVNNQSVANVQTFSGFANSLLIAAQGSAPQIYFTQGTSSGRVPGGELVMVWNGSQIVEISPTNLEQVYNSINTDISSPTGSNPSAPTPAVAADTYVSHGGQVVDAVTVGNVRIPTLNTYPITINITDSQFQSLDDLSVALNLVYPQVGNLLIQLLVPSSVTALTGITTINLVNNAVTASGASTHDGLPSGSNLGVIPEQAGNGTIYIDTGATVVDAGTGQVQSAIGGTIFQENGIREITDTSAGTGRIGIFAPEGDGTLEALLSAGLPATALDGTWTLEITSFGAMPQTPIVENLDDWSLTLTGGISTKGFGVTRTVASQYAGIVVSSGILPASGEPLIGGANGLYNLVPGTFSTVTNFSGPNGIGPSYGLAIDNTLGSFSPYQGRMYMVYTGYEALSTAEEAVEPGINVFITYSDDNGETWSTPTAFTDDSASTDFSQGNRDKFDPDIAVDPVTGTVVVTYYDGRFDPQGLRYANALQTSIDGGVTFSDATFVNELNTATDFLNQTSGPETIEPISGQPSLSVGTSSSGAGGFGERPSSLVVYGGQVTVLFGSNLNSGFDRYGGVPYEYSYTYGASIFSTTVTFADGPRVLTGDEGAVTEDATTPVTSAVYNNTFAADGTRELTGFVITFDRPVLAADVNNTTVSMMFQSPSGGPMTSVGIGAVTPLDLGSTEGMPGLSSDNPLATTFFVALATPAAAVGSYSYAVGPAIFDDIRSEEIGGPLVAGTEMDENADGSPGEPQDAFAMPDPLSGIPYDLPYAAGSEPLVIPGPHVVYTYLPGATPPTAQQVDQIEDGTIQQTDNVDVNGSVSSIVLLFDRNMNPSTFDYNPNVPGETDPILSIMGPNGPISGPFTITSDPAGTASALAARTFLVSFPQQVLSGSYTITFAPTAQDTHGNAVDTNENAGVYVVEGTDPTSTATTSSSYTNSTPVTIVPGQTVFSTINIGDAFEITQTSLKHIQVQLNINYPNDPDLQASLISPTGVVIPLFTNVGKFGAPPLSNFENTIFDDFASTPIQTGSVPFDVGPFNPQEPLSSLIGEGSEGKWTLAITDTNPTANPSPSKLTYWTLTLPHVLPGSGLGEPVADQFTANFRIFTQSPTLATSSNSYTAIGPASENGLLYDQSTGKYDIVSPNAISGEVNTIAVDPSDPSGNTVYVGSGTGGIWKTTNFLTTNPNGPTWIPLASFGPTNSLNIQSLAVLGVNGNPNQSVIYALTGNANLYSADGYPANPTTAESNGLPNSSDNDVEGVGLLRSEDGGKTWQVLTGLNNVNSSGGILPIESSLRDNTFVGQVGFKVAIDPTRLPDGQIVVYAAMSGGLYRSIDSGNTWQLIKAGVCTDVTLAPGSTDANGNEQILYAAFQSSTSGGSGVFMTTNATTTTSLTLMAGGQGVNTRVQNGVTGGLDVPIPVVNDGLSPNGGGGRIVLSTPNLTGSPLQNTFYQGWVYAAEIGSNGSLVGLYLTKDFGNNWTKVDLPVYLTSPNSSTNYTNAYPTNNTNDPSFDPTTQPSQFVKSAQGNYDISLAIDPTNPNVVYLGGNIINGVYYNGQQSEGLIRIDTSKLLDTYAAVGYLNNAPNSNTQYGAPVTGANVVAATGDAVGSMNVTYSNIDVGEFTSVSSVSITSGGSGYTTAPSVTFSPPPPGGIAAQGFATIHNGSVIGVTITNPGIGYIEAPTITFGGPGSGASGFANAGDSSTSVETVSILNGGSGYTTAPTVVFGPAPPGGITAQGFATVENGVIVSVTITNPGTGYLSAPAISFSGTGAGARAIATLLPTTYGFTNATTGLIATAYGSPNFLNLYRDPGNPFVQPSTLQFQDITQFNNTGYGAQWSPFSYFLDNSTNYQAIVAETDPVTGETRILVGDDDGIFTGVDNGNNVNDVNNQAPDEGFTDTISGTRNGNLQLAQLDNGASQPSTLAAQITGALYYGAGSAGRSGTAGTTTSGSATYIPSSAAGAASSTANILTTGNITWNGVESQVQDIATDATGTGTLYQFVVPEATVFPFLPTDFFEVTPVQGGQAPSQITSRTTGLLLSGDNPIQNAGEWPEDIGYNFAVNPVDPSTILASSEKGNVFRTEGSSTGYGVQWFEIATGAQLDNSNAEAMAFGAPQAQNNLDNFIYAGTVDGHIYVTTNGGGTWTNISAGLDNSAVQQIVTDPNRGSTDAYAVTLKGVYYMANATAPNATWVKLDDTTGMGSLFTLMRGNYNNAGDPMPTLQYLTSIAVDWRYAIPNNPANPTGPTHPVLYVAGNGGVFRSLDQGKTWTYYPDVTLDGAVSEEGNLPNLHITGLNLVLGDINPATGFPNTSSGLNQLVVTTFGGGEYAIRLDSSVLVNGKPLKTYLDSPNGGAAVSTVSEIVPIPGTALTGFQVTFAGAIDPTTFTSQEVDYIRGPGGQTIQVASVTNVTPTPPPGQGSLNNVYDIIFATPQTATGNYQLAIGPGITDDSGNPMAAVYSNTLFFTADTPPTITPGIINVPPIPPGTTYQVNFTVGSAQYSASQLVVTANAVNSALVGTLSLNHTGANYTLTISPPATLNSMPNTGQTQVSITVEDPETLTTTSAFNVIVDQAPVLQPTNSISMPPDDYSTYQYTIGATSPEGLPLTYTATTRGDSLLFDLQSQYQFTGVAYYNNTAAAYVLHSNQPGTGVGGYYLINPTNGGVYAYDGSGSYAHSYTAAPLAILGPNVYNDPSLLFNAQPPADYVTLNNLETTYHFVGLAYYTNTASAYVLQASTNSSYGNPYYLLRPDGSLFAYDGQGGYAHTYQNTTPIAILGPNLYSHPNELLNSVASPSLYAQLYQLTSQYDLQEIGGSFYTNNAGNQAQWIYSPILNQYGQHWYTLILNSGGTTATLRAWEGYNDSSVGAAIATLPASVYQNPTLLTNATYLPNPAVTTSINQSTGVLTIGLPSNSYVGTFVITITASDGLLSASQTLTAASQDTAPTVTVQQGVATVTDGSIQSFTHGTLSGGVQFTLTPSGGENGAGGDTLNATISIYNAAFALQQEYQFKGVGYYSNTASAYVVQAVGNNIYGNPYYLISTTGGVYAYDDSGSYAHTFANVKPLATLGANYYSDPSLLFNAEPAVDYSTLYNLQLQHQFMGLGYFTAGSTAYVLVASSNNTFGNPYYLLTPNGNLYPDNEIGAFTNTINNVTPIATLDPQVYVDPSLLLNAKALPTMYPQLYQVEQQLDLEEYQGSFYTGQLGNAAKWLLSPIANSHQQNWYTLVLSANGTQALLYAWDGGANSVPVGAQPVATFDPSVYYDPTLLLNAKAPEAAIGVIENLSGNTLTVTAPNGFVGNALVQITASDGILTTSPPFTFQIQSTDTAPVPNTIPPQTASQSGSPLMITLGSTDAENDTVTYTAAAVGYSAAYNLQQVYQFKGVGYITDSLGQAAYVMTSSVLGGVGGYYLINPTTGDVYAYDGSGSYAHTFNNSSALVANLSPNIYTTPTLLTNAQPPAAPSVGVNVSGNLLSVNVAGVSPGTVFQVVVTANDGAESTRTSFLVTVTA